MTEQEAALGFAAPHDMPVPYIHRITSYYLALVTVIPIAGRNTPMCRLRL